MNIQMLAYIHFKIYEVFLLHFLQPAYLNQVICNLIGMIIFCIQFS